VRVYEVVVEDAEEGGLVGSIKGKPGYLTQAENIEELFSNMGEVITLMEEDE
jgi:predicted RNase H-like HicB family nuclease